MPVESEGVRTTLAIALLGWVVLTSLVVFILFAVDKHRAVHGRWRIPEARLHLLEWLGGWPGAILGMMFIRHKRRKPGYVFLTMTAAITWVAVAVWLLKDGVANWGNH